MAELAAGAVVAGCRVEAVVGRGGMGVVYRAVQLSLERPVALKAIAPELAGDPTFRERFKRESRIAASIEHPNVIPVYEAGEGDGLLYLVMRYVEGTDLRALIDAEGALPPERAVRIVAQVGAALAAAHRRDLIHRDVKPANVLIDSGGEQDHAYLTDFGIARHSAATSGLTRTGSVIGTLDYLAPERIQDEGGDGRSDVYALGCVLYEALTGALPFERENDVAKMYAHLNAPVPSVLELAPDVPASLDELARRAMAKDPADRFTSASEFAEALTDELPARAPRAAAAETAEAEAPAPIPPPPGEPEPADAELPDTEPALPAGISEEIALEAETGEEMSLAERRAEPPAEPEQEPEAAEATSVPAEPETATAALAPAAATASRPAKPPPARSRGVLLAVAGAGLVAAVVILVLVLSGGDPEREAGAPPETSDRSETAQQPEPEPPAPLAFQPAGEVSLAPGPDGLAAADGTVWAANKDTGQVIPIDETSGEPGEPVDVGRNPDSVAIGFGSVWVTNTDDDSVSRIDPETGEVQDTVQVGHGPEGIAVTDEAVFVANGRGGSVSVIPPDGTEPLPPEPVGDGPVQIAVTGDNRVWVTLSGADTVVELNPTTGTPIGEAATVGGQPRGIAFDGERLWVSATSGGYLAAFPPDAPDVIQRVRGIRGPREVRFGLGAIWVTTGSNERLIAIDPQSGERIRSFRVGPLAYGLAVSDGFAWAASEQTGRVIKVEPSG